MLNREKHPYAAEFCRFLCVPPHSNLCASLNHLMNCEAHGYKITSLCTSGSYGVVFNGIDSNVRKLIVKVYNLSGIEQVDMKNRPWYPTTLCAFQQFVKTHKGLYIADPSLVATPILDSLYTLPSGAQLGVQVVTNSGTLTLLKALDSASQSEKVFLSTAAGRLLSRLHSAGYSHGDAHTANIVMSDSADRHLTLIDVDYAIYFDQSTRKSRTNFTTCKLFDLCCILSDLSEVRSDAELTCLTFYRAYQKSQSVSDLKLLEEIEHYLLSPCEIETERKQYDRIYNMIVK